MRFKRMTAEGEMELVLPDVEGSPVLVQLWEGDDDRQLLLFETVDGTSSEEALQIGSEMRARFRSVHYVATLVEPTTKQ